MRIDEQDMDVDRCWDNNLDDDFTWCGQSLHTSDRAPYNLRIKSERTDFEHLANSQQYLATRKLKSGSVFVPHGTGSTPPSPSLPRAKAVWNYWNENTAILENLRFKSFQSLHCNDCQRIFLAWGLELNINVYCGCQKHSPFHFFLQIPVIFQSQFLNFGPCLEPMMLLKIFKRQFLYFFKQALKKIWDYSRIFLNTSMEKS